LLTAILKRKINLASKNHQFILSSIVRKMKLNGYEIIAYDGDYSKIEDIKLEIPFKILRHRPDVIGISLDKTKIYIGEAKTKSDLRSERTKEEFEDFALIGDEIDQNVKLIIGIPKSANLLLYRIIVELGLQENDNIDYILVPEDLLSNA